MGIGGGIPNPDGAYVGTGCESKTAIPTTTAGDIVIPSTLGGEPVVGIDEHAFDSCDKLTSITIPSNMACIVAARNGYGLDDNPFAHCRNLRSIKVKTGNSFFVSIDDVLFRNVGPADDGLRLISYPSKIIGPYSIPENVIEIADGAFTGCDGLTSLTIPKSLECLLSHAFIDCTNLCSFVVATNHPSLTSVDGIIFGKALKYLFRYPTGKIGAYSIPNHTEGMAWGAFLNCTGLTAITIPASMTNGLAGCFGACKNLQSIDVAKDNSQYISLGGVLFDKNMRTLIAFPGGRHGAYSIPASTTNIKFGAFHGCNGLKFITIPNTVTHIGDGAFWECNALNHIDFEGTPPTGLINAEIKKDATIRYNAEHEAEWFPVIEACGFQNAKPYTPKQSKGTTLFLTANNHLPTVQ